MSNVTASAEQPKPLQNSEAEHPQPLQNSEAEQPKSVQNSEAEHPQTETWTKFAPVSSVIEDEPYEVPEIRTQLPLPARPFIKGGFALAFSGGVLVLIAIFFQLAGGIGWNQEKQSSSQPDNQAVAKTPSSEMTAQEKLQWCLATRKCGEIENPSKDTTKTATTKPNATPQGKKPAVLVARTSIRPQSSYNTAQEFSRPVQIQQPEQPPVSPHPVVSTLPVAQPTLQPASPQQQTSDPLALLAQASNMGTYTTSGEASPSPDLIGRGAGGREQGERQASDSPATRELLHKYFVV